MSATQLDTPAQFGAVDRPGHLGFYPHDVIIEHHERRRPLRALCGVSVVPRRPTRADLDTCSECLRLWFEGATR